jgi:hypothetical protein
LAFSATTADTGAAVLGATAVDASVGVGAAVLGATAVDASVGVDVGVTGAAAPNDTAAAVVLGAGTGRTAASVPEVHAATTAAIAASRTARPLPLYMAAAMLGGG